MPELFETTRINGMTLPNRFVRSATWAGMANPDGTASARLTELLTRLARGGVGLIISGHAYVSPEGQATPGQLAVHGDTFVPKLLKMTRAIHGSGGRIVLQLAHAGCHAAVNLTGRDAIGPSALSGEKLPECRPMTAGEIDATIDAFAQGARRAVEAGFDGVQIHAAHGYCLSQFLSGFYNRREDGYGGSPENRSRLLLEVCRRVRKTVGTAYPVLVKMNAEDFVEGGLTVEEMVAVARNLEEAGVDAVELSGGVQVSPPKLSPVRTTRIASPEDEVYYREAARTFKASVSLPLILVGGIRSLETASALVSEEVADYIAMSRPLIREPALVNRWRSGDTEPAACSSDNQCFRPALEGRGIYCVTEQKMRKADPT